MYVADMTLEDATATLRELQSEQSWRESLGLFYSEQLEWDIEDVAGRIEELELVK